jgi:hypothetical protein
MGKYVAGIFVVVTGLSFIGPLLAASTPDLTGNTRLEYMEINDNLGFRASLGERIAFYDHFGLEEDSARIASHCYESKKKVGTAILIAAVPGLIVHGLGHAYVGDSKTFGTLLGLQLFTGIVAAVYWSSATSDEPQTPAIQIASAVWLGTYLYDILGSASKVSEFNRRLETGNASVQLSMRDSTVKFGLIVSF